MSAITEELGDGREQSTAQHEAQGRFLISRSCPLGNGIYRGLALMINGITASVERFPGVLSKLSIAMQQQDKQTQPGIP